MDVRITVAYNNVPLAPDLRTGWGLACLVETASRTVLFDTGGDGDVLLENMRRLDLDPSSIDAVMLSHLHGDHTGGLAALLGVHADVDVWLPGPPPTGLRRSIEVRGARPRPIAGSCRLGDGIATTGPLGERIVEQALSVDVGEQIVVVTGCAHPGVDRMARAATATTGKPIRLLMGGFHLKMQRRSQVRAVIGRLQELGVETVAPSHCTGQRALAAFRRSWGDGFLDGGLGAVIDV